MSRFHHLFKNRLLSNIAANQAGFLVSAIVAFFLSPFVIQSLGPKDYGIWALIVSFTGHYGLLAFGLKNALTRYIAHASAKNEQQRVNGYFNSGLIFLSISAILVLLLGAGIAFWIESIFVIPAEDVVDTKIALYVVTITTAVTLIFSIFESTLVANQMFSVTNSIGVVSTLIRAALTLIILDSGLGLIALALLGLFVNITQALTIAFVVLKHLKYVKIGFRYATINSIKELLSYSYKTFFITVAVILVYQSDLFVIGLHLPPEEVGKYSLATMLITYLMQFVNSTAYTFSPHATRMVAEKKEIQLKTFFITSSIYMYMVGGFAVGGFLIFGHNFFSLWVGPNYSESSTILSLLIIPQFFAIGARVGGSILIGMAKVGPLAIVAIGEGVINLILSLILVRFYGLIGVAIGTIIPSIIANAILVPLIYSKYLEFNFVKTYSKILSPGVLVFFATYIIGGAIQSYITPNHWQIFMSDILLLSLSVCPFFLFPMFSQYRQKIVWPIFK